MKVFKVLKGGNVPAAMDPVDVEVLCEECRANHSDALLHPACLPQLPHAGIHHGEASLALLPSLQGS